jgi:hypothetical protein
MSTRKNDAGFVAEQRRLVNAEVNSRKVVIDRDIFKKTDAEREELKSMKRLYKASL